MINIYFFQKTLLLIYKAFVALKDFNSYHKIIYEYNSLCKI